MDDVLIAPSSNVVRAPSFHLAPRLAALAGLFTIELVAISIWLDTASIDGKPGLVGLVSAAGPGIVQAIVTFAALFVTFGYLRIKETLPRTPDAPVSLKFLAAHLAAMLVFCRLSALVFAGTSGNALAALWLVAGIAAILLAGFAFVPPQVSSIIFQASGWTWAYAAAGTAAVSLLTTGSRLLWQPASALTFRLVKLILQPFFSDVIANPAKLIIGTPKFKVYIASGCSGLEGAGLMLVFSIAWLWFFRHECRFPRALLLIPAGIAILWLLNAMRIASLILIGNAGARGIALGGFHSQTGWITFNAVALGLSIATRRWSWLRVSPATPAHLAEPNPVAPYLMPFLAILATAIISRAASSDFDWLYPLRFFAAAACLWYFRDRYRALDLRFGWLAPVTGILVFALWLGLDRFSAHSAPNAIAAGLARLSEPARLSWLSFRALAAIVTVPIAEELAFRGFLIRRLISADFEAVPLTRFTWLSLLASSLAFGLMHGDRWIAGTLAGVIYALLLLRRGRIADAIVAHATTNALLAAWVLFSHNWNLW